MRTRKLAVGLAGEPYSAVLEVDGGVAPLTFSIAAGQLPRGLALDAASGRLEGTPTQAGRYEFSVAVRDAQGGEGSRSYGLLIDRSLGRAADALGSPIKPQTDRATRLSATETTGSPNLTDLQTVVAGMSEGQWQRVNLNSFSAAWTPAELRPLFGQSNPTPASIILAWSGFAWDSNRGNLLLYGGGHANYRGNDVYLWRGSTRMWERAALPSEMVSTPLGYWNAIDGADKAPASAHTYDNNIFLPLLDRMLVLGGAADPNGGHFVMQPTPTTTRVTGPYLFDPGRAHPDKVGGTTGSHVQRVAPHPEIVGGNMWQNRESWLYASASSTPPTHVLSDGCTGYAQENGRDVVYVKNPHRVHRYQINDINNPAADVWTEVGTYFNAGSGGQTVCAYDPGRKLLVTTHLSATQPFVFWDMALAGPGNRDVLVSPTDPTGEFYAWLASNWIGHCGIDFDPKRSNFKLWCGGGAVWTLTPPATATATGWIITKAAAFGGSVPTESVGTGILGKWKYIPNLDAFIGLLDAVEGNIWVYKPHGWVGPAGGGNSAPSVGIREPASGTMLALGSNVTVSADAADPGGRVTKVEFYANGVKFGERTQAPYSVSWKPGSTGDHALVAAATDDAGARTTSAVTAVTVRRKAGRPK
ncbi:MAG TPA: Ig-like domain-containing protein [Burkholderiaceae bacterium]|nr:Ig-like domain-containing protein [Burkholderiaceae bacterium]